MGEACDVVCKLSYKRSLRFWRGAGMNKESIFRQLELRLAGCSLTADALGAFSAMAIADSLRQKRSIISHHLNNLHREQRVVKVNSRPVLFLPVEALRRHHRLAVRQGITRPFRRCARSGRTVWSCSLAHRAACRSPCVSVRRRSVIPARACLCCCAARRGQEKFLARQLWQYAIEQGILPRRRPLPCLTAPNTLITRNC